MTMSQSLAFGMIAGLAAELRSRGIHEVPVTMDAGDGSFRVFHEPSIANIISREAIFFIDSLCPHIAENHDHGWKHGKGCLAQFTFRGDLSIAVSIDFLESGVSFRGEEDLQDWRALAMSTKNPAGVASILARVLPDTFDRDEATEALKDVVISMRDEDGVSEIFSEALGPLCIRLAAYDKIGMAMTEIDALQAHLRVALAMPDTKPEDPNP